MGRTAIFEVGPVTLLVSELRGLGGNVPEVYRANGVEPRTMGSLCSRRRPTSSTSHRCRLT